MVKQIQQTVQSSAKAVEIIGNDPKMVRLFQNLNISLGFGDVTISQLCARNGISEPFFISLCNLMKNPSYMPDLSSFTSGDIAEALKYLRASHTGYRKVSLPDLHANVHKIAGMCPPETSAIVNSFFDDYDAEMNKHIEIEESEAFTHIEGLLAGKLAEGVAVEDFREPHDDVSVKLEDFKNILVKYVPDSCNIPERYSAVIQIMHIAESISFHTIIEDRILYPLASELEKQLKRN